MGLLRRLKDWLTGRKQESSATDETGEQPMVSLVLLLSEPRYLDDAILRRLVEQAWNKQFHPTDPDAKEFVVSGDVVSVIRTTEGMFLVNNFPSPYVDDPVEAAQSLRELRTRKAFAEHKAWLSVDLIGAGDDEQSLNEAYRRIGSLTSALLDADCLAVFCPATKQIAPVDPDLADRLRGHDVLALLGRGGYVPVIDVDSSDEAMQAAVAEARRRWPEFVQAFENRQPGEPFLVKGPFAAGDQVEFMWIEVDALENDLILGRLANDPVNIPSPGKW